MSAHAPSNPRAREPAEVGPVALPEPVLRHLGRLLADAYRRDVAAADPATRFADALAALDDAVRGARRDGDAAFRAELTAQLPALRRFAVSLTRDPTAADDLVQNALVRAWRGRAGFAPGTNLRAWIFTILRNQFRIDRRRLGREVQDEAGDHAARLAVPPDQTDRLDLADMRTALAELPAPMREALLLVAVEDLTYEEAAAVMGCEVGTAKSRVWRARARIVRSLGYGGDALGQEAVTLSAMGSP